MDMLSTFQMCDVPVFLFFSPFLNFLVLIHTVISRFELLLNKQTHTRYVFAIIHCAEIILIKILK